MRAMSGLMIFLWNNLGISCRKMGIESARPSATALRTLPPMNKDADLERENSIEGLVETNVYDSRLLSAPVLATLEVYERQDGRQKKFSTSCAFCQWHRPKNLSFLDGMNEINNCLFPL